MEKDTFNQKIISRIKNLGAEEVFVASDFSDIAEINTIRQILSREEKNGNIQRILRGVYYCPEYSELLDEFEAPSPHQVALALARKFGWTIAPSGNTALNQLGLSTQVSAKWSYISDGPYKKFEFDSIELEFKHRSNKDISGLSYKTALVIQALRALGKNYVDETVVLKLKELLSKEEKEALIVEAKQCTAWVYEYIKKICKEMDN